MTTTTLPGTLLGSTVDLAAGAGTYVNNGQIYASVYGTKEISGQAGAKSTVSVVHNRRVSIVPSIGDVVYGRILRISQQLAAVAIVSIDGKGATSDEFQGIVRLQNVRATEIDKIVMHNMFRPGDIIRAEVLSLGDSRSYYLSTADNRFGVIYAVSASAGCPMVPISWEQMQCPLTGDVEMRKCAKPSSE
ncbi:hypothetical protein GQ42DRAFT_76564 [Ramicandelaber brevisporus]|nr:hypothetical protein GQ42DRAFT_76564 [Ramicandelaber brevisporus]